jgi:hypothetical protein
MSGLMLEAGKVQMSENGLNIKKPRGERVLLIFTHLHREMKFPEGSADATAKLDIQ